MKRVLMLAAISEAATGAGLLMLPTIVVRLLLGAEPYGVALVIARVTGIALVALAVACWPGQMNPFRGMFAYNVLMSGYLAWLGFQGERVGPLLWLVVVLHLLITILFGLVWFLNRRTERSAQQLR
jgi:hypothetical protein